MDKRVHGLVKAAIKKGILSRPDACSKCGSSPKTKDGRSAIQGHHADYSKPLDVEWLCPKCHRAITPLPEVMGAPTFGEKNGQAKLTTQLAEAIRASELGCRKLSAIYGVDKKTIQRVRNGTHWSAAAPTQQQEGGS
ncbi:hypothetical protein ACI2T7_03570 [Ralstonia nicotianae]